MGQDRYHGLGLVSKKGTVAKQGTRRGHDNTRIERAGYIADILTSTSFSGQIFHYVIQRKGSAEIAHWGQELSMQRALECVNEFLDEAEKRLA